MRYSTSYPTPRVPYEPRCDKSLRSLAELTPAAAASSSLDTDATSRSASAYKARRYSGRRAMVASGMPCRLLCDLVRRDIRRQLLGDRRGGRGSELARIVLSPLTVRPCERMHKVGGAGRPDAGIAGERSAGQGPAQ